METSRKQKDKDVVGSKTCTPDIRSFMLSSKRTCLTSLIECERILNEDSHPVPHLEDVVVSDSDDSEPGPGEGLLATCPNSSVVKSISNSVNIDENSDVPSTSASTLSATITSIVPNNDK